jgi:hypothetical protein
MPWGFNLSFDLANEEHQCELAFDARIYDPKKVQSFLQIYLRLLEGISLAPDKQMKELVRLALK